MQKFKLQFEEKKRNRDIIPNQWQGLELHKPSKRIYERELQHITDCQRVKISYDNNI